MDALSRETHFGFLSIKKSAAAAASSDRDDDEGRRHNMIYDPHVGLGRVSFRALNLSPSGRARRLPPSSEHMFVFSPSSMDSSFR